MVKKMKIFFGSILFPIFAVESQDYIKIGTKPLVMVTALWSQLSVGAWYVSCNNVVPFEC